ncbi:MAG: hypothetical protein IJN75_04205 [Clostridia bacterium]|nr:hypothetical protein [Clostridia bacterium]
MIVDSGHRHEFDLGAVRDVQEGKGRCDLLPLDVVAELYNDDIFSDINNFIRSGDTAHLYEVLKKIAPKFGSYSTMLLEVSIHFEEGAKKYNERNWEKGINAKNYINSGVRHLLKWIRGDEDENHERAFVFNIMCCIWTCKNKPELNDFRKETEND